MIHHGKARRLLSSQIHTPVTSTTITAIPGLINSMATSAAASQYQAFLSPCCCHSSPAQNTTATSAIR